MRERRRVSARRALYAFLVLGAVAATLLFILWGSVRPAGESTHRGTLVMRDASGAFTVCGESKPITVTDTSGALARVYGELAGGSGQSVFAEIRGSRRGDRFDIAQLRRMEPESRGCDEDLSGMDFRAFGNEPFWSMDVGSRRIVLTRPGMAPVTFPDARRTISHETRIYTAHVEGRRLELALTEQPCRDTMAGSYYAWTASAKVTGESFEGCAKEGRP